MMTNDRLITPGEALTIELALALKDRLFALHAELRLRLDRERQYFLTGLHQAAHEVLELIENWPQPDDTMRATMWRADCAWADAMVVLDKIRKAERAAAIGGGR